MLEMFDSRMCDLEAHDGMRLVEVEVNGHEPQKPHAWVFENESDEEIERQLEISAHHYFGKNAVITEWWFADYLYKSVINKYGTMIDYELAVSMMDDDIREDLHSKLAPCSKQEFFDDYCDAHREKFEEDFEPDKENPNY